MAFPADHLLGDIDWERKHSESFQGAFHRLVDIPVGLDIAAAAVVVVDQVEVDIERLLMPAEGVVVVGIVDFVAVHSQWAACQASVAFVDP